ncbi:MAG: hypothetical protein GWP08_00815 [Nitrospiraceae bacterium]|nr:hypothetical protein [Nitrospiraceae bacterium]
MYREWVILGGVAVFGLLAAAGTATAQQAVSSRLPDDVLPVIAAWFWWERDFAPNGFAPYLDMMAEHSAVNVLAASLRAPNREVTSADVHEQIKQAAAYANRLGMRVAMDLDVRLARRAFLAAHPDEQQEMLRLREVALNGTGAVEFSIGSDDLSDHYTFATEHYIPLSGRLVRVYSYTRGPDGIEPGSVRDITGAACTVLRADAEEVRVSIACSGETAGRTACVAAAFTHLTPAVFAPHLVQFQRSIIESYADTELAGVCKDEWGFPPCFDGCPDKNDYWFSRFRAEAYAERTQGGDLVRDCLLMTFGEQGRERDRQAAINTFLEMSTQRNAALEDAFYRATKDVFGPLAIVATHPTWYPYPGTREFKKNGLSWWTATRDLAQTDEVTPYCARTALAKKWNSPVWYNMYYSRKLGDYRTEVWAHALGGGRIDYHPLYPREGVHPEYHAYAELLRGGLMRGDCRVRLLNFITRTPLDCPVAVVFGHACAMNWAGPSYDDVGIGLTDALWQAGYPADLIPSSEIHNGSLRVDADGTLRYGPQRYRAAVLYHPEFERSETAALFAKAAGGSTALYRVGEWACDHAAAAFDGAGALPAAMETLNDAAALVDRLREMGVRPQSPATRMMTEFGRSSAAPGTQGECRLIDGTVIRVSGAEDVAGDPIRAAFEVDGHAVTVDAVGVVGVRLDDEGALDALAAGGLKRFQGGGLHIELGERVDIALWRDAGGAMHGVLQDWPRAVPEPLLALTGDWLRLSVPTPMP